MSMYFVNPFFTKNDSRTLKSAINKFYIKKKKWRNNGRKENLKQ